MIVLATIAFFFIQVFSFHMGIDWIQGPNHIEHFRTRLLL